MTAPANGGVVVLTPAERRRLVGDALGCPLPPNRLHAAVASRFGVTAEQAHRAALRLLADAQQLRRSEIAWNLDSHPDALDVPDVTSHGWPDECGARWVVESRDPAHLFPRAFVCTRRTEHTGRHAAGTFTRVTAVWSDGAR